MNSSKRRLLNCIGFYKRAVFGDRHAAAKVRAEAAQRSHCALIHSLSRRSDSLTEEDLENLQARSLLRAYAEAEEQASRPIWLVPQRLSIVFLVVVTVTFIIALLLHAGSIPVELHASLDEIVFAFDSSKVEEPVTLDFEDLALNLVDTHGLAEDRNARAGKHTFGLEGGAATFLRLKSLQLPREREVTIETGLGYLKISIGRRVNGNEQAVRAQFSVPQEATIDFFDDDGKGSEFIFERLMNGSSTVVLEESDNTNNEVELVLELSDQAKAATVAFSAVGADLNEFRLARRPEARIGKIDSFILGGEIRFPNHEIASIPFRPREVVSLSEDDGSPPKGQLVSASIQVTNERDLSIDATWAGVTESLVVGRESLKRNAMPKMIFGWTAQKQTLYLGGFFVYAGIFGFALLTRTRPPMTDVADLPLFPE